MGNLNKAMLTGFVIDSKGIEFEPSKGKSFLTIRSDRNSGTPDDIIVEIPEKFKDTFREWSWVRVSGKFRSRWGRINGRKKVFLYLESDSIGMEGKLLINNVEMEGYICKKPVLRKTPLGKTVCEIYIAVNEHKRSDYIPCICWYELAQKVSEMKIGTKVKLKGRMQSRNYWKKQPDDSYIEKTAYEISIGKMEEVKREKSNFEKNKR